MKNKYSKTAHVQVEVCPFGGGKNHPHIQRINKHNHEESHVDPENHIGNVAVVSLSRNDQSSSLCSDFESRFVQTLAYASLKLHPSLLSLQAIWDPDSSLHSHCGQEKIQKYVFGDSILALVEPQPQPPAPGQPA